jgi:hypothetical protein
LLRYVAKVRAGFTPAQRVAVFERFQALEIETCLFNNLPEARRGQWGEGLKASEMKKCRWLKPRLLATIDYLGTDGGESLATSDVRGSIRKFQRFKNPGRAPANPFDGRAPTVRGFCEFDGGLQVREPSEGKIGRAVLTVALIAATAMLDLVLVSFVGLIVERSLEGAPMQDREVFHTAPQPPERARP